MDEKSVEARIPKFEDGVAQMLPCQNENSSGNVEHLQVRITELENEVAHLRLKIETYRNIIHYFKSDLVEMELTMQKDRSSNSWGGSQAKKKKLSSKSTFESKGFKVHDAVKVYTDGSCYNNGKYNASAGIGVYWGPNSQDNISEKLPGRQSNNRAEIYAAIRAIEQAIKKNIKNLIIHTDSMFLINCITKWIHQWKKKGWLKLNGGKVINKDELQQLDSLLENINVKWVHVSGHCGIPENEAADKLAVKGAKYKKKPGKQGPKKKINKQKKKEKKSSATKI